MTDMTANAKAKAILNLTFDNVRKGDFSDRHAMVDVYLDGKFISTYQWNPFWKMKTEDLAKALKFKGGFCPNRDVESVLGTHYASGFQNLAVWQGKHWNRSLKESYDKLVTELIFKHVLSKIEMPDVYDVESCLVSDAGCIESSLDFKDFCWSFGYSDDSIKAKEIYNQCKDILVRLIQTGKYDELKKLHEED